MTDSWQKFVENQARLRGRGFAGPRLVCIDLQPYATTQALGRHEILNSGGFSDAVFEVVAASFSADPRRFLTEIEAIELCWPSDLERSICETHSLLSDRMAG